MRRDWLLSRPPDPSLPSLPPKYDTTHAHTSFEVDEHGRGGKRATTAQDTSRRASEERVVSVGQGAWRESLGDGGSRSAFARRRAGFCVD